MSGVSTPQAKTAVPRNEIVVPKGTVIFHQGDPGDSLFFIERGRVRIVLHCDGHATDVAVFGPGEFFGELSLLCDAPRTATAEALDDATLFVVRRDVFAMMMQDDLDIVFHMLHTVGERLVRTNHQFEELLKRHSRIRLLAAALGRAAATSARTPQVVELDRLAADLELDSAAVRTTVEELVQQGAGAVEGGRWRFDGADHVGAVVALLRAYAEGHAVTGSRADPSAG